MGVAQIRIQPKSLPVLFRRQSILAGGFILPAPIQIIVPGKDSVLERRGGAGPLEKSFQGRPFPGMGPGLQISQ